MKREAKMILYADSARGQYIPQHFAESVERDLVRGIDLADLDYLALGPNDIEATDDEPAHDSEHYWDTWADVCDNCTVLNPDDAMRPYTLYQDGDLWLIEPDAIFNEPQIAPDVETMFYVDDGEPEIEEDES